MARRRRHGIVRWIESLIKSNSDSRLAGHIRTKITWNRVFRVVSYTKSSLWIVPIVAIVLELIAIRVTHALDAWLLWPLWQRGLQASETMLQTIITLNLSFMVFTFGSLLVAIQVASGQMTPRIIATTLLRDNVVRYSVGLFVFTLMFAVSTLSRTEKEVHQLPVFFAGLLGIFSIAVFLYLIDYASKLLRPVSVAIHIGKEGLDVIDSVYPQETREPTAPAASDYTPSHLSLVGRLGAKALSAIKSAYPQPTKSIEAPAISDRGLGLPERTVLHQDKGEIILAVDLDALVDEAEAADGIIEFVPHVGDFIGVGEPLFLLYGGTAAIDDWKLRASVAFGPERTMEQDPTFAFRILVDIGLKALSPAINDPTTAVLVIDQLQRLLRMAGLRHLHDDTLRDDAGRPRLIFRTPNWGDFVHLTFTEIRHCGAGQVQIARRLRAVIENLIYTLPEHRHQALWNELDLLNRMIEQHYTLPEDRALALIPDSQGLGGSTIRHALSRKED
jgi:uncharacterized membrane protein